MFILVVIPSILPCRPVCNSVVNIRMIRSAKELETPPIANKRHTIFLFLVYV